MGFVEKLKNLFNFYNNKEENCHEIEEIKEEGGMEKIEDKTIRKIGENNIDYDFKVSIPELKFYNQNKGSKRMRILWRGTYAATCNEGEIPEVRDRVRIYLSEGKSDDYIRNALKLEFNIKKPSMVISHRKTKNGRCQVLYHGATIGNCYMEQLPEINLLVISLLDEKKTIEEIKEIVSTRYNLRKRKSKTEWDNLRWDKGRLYKKEEYTGIIIYDLNDMESIIANSEDKNVTRKVLSALPMANRETLLFLLNNYNTSRYSLFKVKGLNSKPEGRVWR